MQQSKTFWRYKLRPFKWDDLYAIQALTNVIAQHEQDPYLYSLEWLYFVLEQPNVNPERNCFVAILETDRIIGYSRIEASEDRSQVKVFAGTHPDFEGAGIGRGLIAISDFNSLSIQSSNLPLTITRQSSSHNLNSANLLSRMGYTQTVTNENNQQLWEKQMR